MMPIIVLCVYLAVELSKYLLCGPIDVCHVKCGQTSVYIGLHGLNWRRETDIIIIIIIIIIITITDIKQPS